MGHKETHGEHCICHSCQPAIHAVWDAANTREIDSLKVRDEWAQFLALDAAAPRGARR